MSSISFEPATYSDHKISVSKFIQSLKIEPHGEGYDFTFTIEQNRFMKKGNLQSLDEALGAHVEEWRVRRVDAAKRYVTMKIDNKEQAAGMLADFRYYELMGEKDYQASLKALELQEVQLYRDHGMGI